MAKYIIKRILAAIPMVLIITVICFALMNLAPYDDDAEYVTGDGRIDQGKIWI